MGNEDQAAYEILNILKSEYEANGKSMEMDEKQIRNMCLDAGVQYSFVEWLFNQYQVNNEVDPRDMVE